MSAGPFVVEYVVVVDHPELRDASYKPVPRGLRISHREPFAKLSSAIAAYNRMLAGEHDYGSEYIGRVVILRKERRGFRIIRKEVRRERRGGAVTQLGDAEATRQRMQGQGGIEIGPRGVSKDVSRIIANEVALERAGKPTVYGPPKMSDAERSERMRAGTPPAELAAMLRPYERDYILAGSPDAHWQQKRDRYGVDPAGDAGKPPQSLVDARLVERVKFVGGRDPKMAYRGGLLTERGRELRRFLRAQAGAQAQVATSESLAAPPVRTPEPPPAQIVPPGQLFTTEAEGFALTAPRGEYGRGMQSQGTQQTLGGVSRQVDAATMAAIVERERAERAARSSSSAASSAPLLAATPADATPLPDLETPPWELEEAPVAPVAHAEPEPEPEAAETGEARLQFVDVVTGEPRSPEAPGTAASGQLVADLEGTTVVVDPEDVVGRGSDPDPRRRRYRFDLESPADYKATARKRKAIERRKPKPIRRPRVPGVQSTFRSPAAAARSFYENNAAFFDHVPDPIDGLRDWADGIDVRVSKGRHKRLAKTQHGARIFAARRGQGQIEAALRWVFGQAKGRRWAAVPWHEIDRLEESLRPYFQGSAGAGISWKPATGELDVATLDAMPPDVRQRVRDYESHREIKDALEQLRVAYRKTRACIPPELRRTVLHRIKAWGSWEKAPERIPAYACEPDLQSGGHLCNYPAVAGELRELRRACEVAYDPDWALPDARAGAPGFPDLSGGEADIAPRPPTFIVAPPMPVAIVATPQAIASPPPAAAARAKTPRMTIARALEEAPAIMGGQRAERLQEIGFSFAPGKTTDAIRSLAAVFVGGGSIARLDERKIAVVAKKLTARQRARLDRERARLQKDADAIAAAVALVRQGKLKRAQHQLERLVHVEQRSRDLDTLLPSGSTSAARIARHYLLRDSIIANAAALLRAWEVLGEAQATKSRPKQRPQSKARPTRPAPQRTAEAAPTSKPAATPKTPTAPIEAKKAKAKTKAAPTRAELEECASMLGREGAKAKARKRRERLSEEERAALLEDALALAIG